MTIRGVLVWYLGTVIAVGGAGATGYQALRQRAAIDAATAAAPATPVVVAEAPPADQPPQSEMQQAPVSVAATEPAHAGPTTTLPTLRPHVAAASKTAVRHVPRAVAATHAPAHHPTLVASARREAPAERQAPYAASPPPVVGYYPAYYPYAGYYAYYPRYGYYRSF